MPLPHPKVPLPSRLYDEVSRLLRETEMKRTEIAKQTGCTAQWLHLIQHKKIKDPGVGLCEKLYHVLTGKEAFNNGES